MSLQKNIFSCQTTQKDSSNSSYKKNLNIIWKQFMSSFGYQKYYNISKDTNKSYSYDIFLEDSKNFEMKSFINFLKQNSITIINDKKYNLISDDKKGNDILSEAKIWIMFIIYIINININNNEINNININVMNIFKEAIKNGCDVISLFEFFLIFISSLKENEFNQIFNNNNINEIIPKEFIMLYNQKKNMLKNIFQKDDNIIINMRNSLNKFLSNDFANNSHSTVFSSNKKEKNNNYLDIKDIKDIIIISKDYLNKGFFFFFKNKNDLKKNEIILNPFINYDFEEEDDYCLMPLLNKYKNYEQKIDANKVLDLINKSIYKNYTYYPHDINIINKLI